MKPVAIFRQAATEGPGYFATYLDRHRIPWQVIRTDEGEAVPKEFFHAADARPELDSAQQEASAGFRAAARAGADEAVVFAWMEWPDRAARDKGMKLAMEDPRMQFDDAEGTFAGNRLIACGFIPILQA